jgi:8-oxo-dGTP diphosphatase
LKLSRFAGIVLINDEAKVLLQLRSSFEGLYPNWWTLPGGKVEEGETSEQAIRREVKEELGLDLHSCDLFETIVEKTEDETVERRIYWANISERVESLILGEGAVLEYFSSAEVSKLNVAFDLKPVIMNFLKTRVPRQE